MHRVYLGDNMQTLLAIKEASKIFEKQHKKRPKPRDFMVLSLGTGKPEGDFIVHQGSIFDWFVFSFFQKGKLSLVDLLMDASSDMVELYTAYVLDAHRDSNPNYLRIQVLFMSQVYGYYLLVLT